MSNMVTIRHYPDGSMYAAINGRDIGEVHSFKQHPGGLIDLRITALQVNELDGDENERTKYPIHNTPPPKFVLLDSDPPKGFWARLIAIARKL